MSTTNPDLSYEVQKIPVDKIFLDWDFNCRGKVYAPDVVDLAQNIAKDGLQQPITVQPYAKVPGYAYRCVAGHRRLMAFKVNKTEFIPAFVRAGLSDLTAHTLNLKENLLRSNLNIIQEANALRPYLAVSWTEQEIANEFEQSKGWVQVRKILLGLPEDIQKDCQAGILTQEQIRRLGGYKKGSEEQYALYRKIKEHKEKGEKVKLQKPTRKILPHDKKPRQPSEIFAMNMHLANMIGASLVTRALAWAAGGISDQEFNYDLATYCEETGREYKEFSSESGQA
jgi:ParB/RepB/Spo0J family partition protein